MLPAQLRARLPASARTSTWRSGGWRRPSHAAADVTAARAIVPLGFVPPARPINRLASLLAAPSLAQIRTLYQRLPPAAPRPATTLPVPSSASVASARQHIGHVTSQTHHQGNPAPQRRPSPGHRRHPARGQCPLL